MNEPKTKVTYLVLEDTERKLKALGKRNWQKPGATVDMLVSDAWQKAKTAGLVTDAMLEGATISTLQRPNADAQIVPVINVRNEGPEAIVPEPVV